MNTDTGTFHEIDENDNIKGTLKRVPTEWLRFTVGQLVDIDGHKFKIRKITGKDLVLRPVVVK